MVRDPDAPVPNITASTAFRTKLVRLIGSLIVGAVLGGSLTAALCFLLQAVEGVTDKVALVGDYDEDGIWHDTEVWRYQVGPPKMLVIIVGLCVGAVAGFAVGDIFHRCRSYRWHLIIALICLYAASIWDLLCCFREPMPISTWPLEFSPDGRILAGLRGIGRENGFKLWVVSSGQEIATRMMPGKCIGLAFSLDGKMLATADTADDLQIWQTRNGQELMSFLNHHGTRRFLALTHAMKFSPSGDLLATLNEDGTVSLWDLSARKERVNLKASGAGCMAFAPDGHTLATGEGKGVTTLWDTSTGSRLATLQGHSGWITFVAYSPDGTALATANDFTERHEQSKTTIWNIASRQPIRVFDNKSTGLSDFRLCFGADGKALIVAICPRIWRWDIETGQETGGLSVAVLDNDSHTRFDPSLRMLTMYEGDGRVRQWDLETMEQKNMFSVEPSDKPWDRRQMALAASKECVAIGDQDVRVFESATGRLVATLKGWGVDWVPSDQFRPHFSLPAALGALWLAWSFLWWRGRAARTPVTSPTPARSTGSDLR